jgi:HK97 gp10 family phage protein
MARIRKTKITGAKQLDNALKQLPKATSKNVLRRSLIKAAKPTAQFAETLAPRGASGSLVESIEVGTKLAKSQQRGAVRYPVNVYVGPNMREGFYAPYVEFGTEKATAQPFMRPAWIATRGRVLNLFGDEVWKALEKSARTLARKAASGKLSKTARRTLTR